jgi:hypothetical protein
MENSLAIIGAGRVGRALGRRLRELGWKIGAVKIARSIGGSPVKIPNGKKVLYHAAATMAANILAVEEAASQLLMSLGMKRNQATQALLTLTRQVLENMEHLGPRAAWTGPLSRGDYRVLEAHLEALQNFPEEFAQAHELLNRLAARLLAQDVGGMLAEWKKITQRRNQMSWGATRENTASGNRKYKSVEWIESSDRAGHHRAGGDRGRVLQNRIPAGAAGSQRIRASLRAHDVSGLGQRAKDAAH